MESRGTTGLWNRYFSVADGIAQVIQIFFAWLQVQKLRLSLSHRVFPTQLVAGGLDSYELWVILVVIDVQFASPKLVLLGNNLVGILLRVPLLQVVIVHSFSIQAGDFR